MHIHYSGVVILMFVVITGPCIGDTAFLFIYNIAFLAAGSIKIIIDHRLVAITLFRVVRILEARGHGTELAIYHQVVENIRQHILFSIYTTTLLTVATPTGIDDCIIVGLNLSLAARFALA